MSEGTVAWVCPVCGLVTAERQKRHRHPRTRRPCFGAQVLREASLNVANKNLAPGSRELAVAWCAAYRAAFDPTPERVHASIVAISTANRRLGLVESEVGLLVPGPGVEVDRQAAAVRQVRRWLRVWLEGVRLGLAHEIHLLGHVLNEQGEVADEGNDSTTATSDRSRSSADRAGK